MTTALISTLSPILCGSAVLAADKLQVDPAIARELFRHSGNRYGSAIVKYGALPSISFETPFLAAYNAFGFATTKLTAFRYTFAKFLDFAKDPAATHDRWSLAAGCTAAARIQRAVVNQRGLLMAEVQIVPLSSTDGMTHPLAESTAALDTLSAEPALHTLGPCSVETVKINGVKNQGLDLGITLTGEPNDGELYLRTVGELESNPLLMGEHADPRTMLASLGMIGHAITTSAIMYFRSIDATTGAALGTGLSMSIASGSIDPGMMRFSRAQIGTLGFGIQPLSTTNTHPVVVNTSATMPAG